MKQKDIALIIVIVFISAVISIFVSKSLIVKPANRQQEVEVVKVISSDFKPPDSQYFNSQSFDPTQNITIGNSTNPDPFSKKTQ
jgi:hypothetical protein